jgi:hypothetical protein
MDAATTSASDPDPHVAASYVDAPGLPQDEEPDEVADRRPASQREEDHSRKGRSGNRLLMLGLGILQLIWVVFLAYLALRLVQAL